MAEGILGMAVEDVAIFYLILEEKLVHSLSNQLFF